MQILRMSVVTRVTMFFVVVGAGTGKTMLGYYSAIGLYELQILREKIEANEMKWNKTNISNLHTIT